MLSRTVVAIFLIGIWVLILHSNSFPVGNIFGIAAGVVLAINISMAARRRLVRWLRSDQ